MLPDETLLLTATAWLPEEPGGAYELVTCRMVVMGMGIRMCMCMFMPSIVQHVTTYARTIVQLNIFPVSQESVQAVRERVPYCVARDESSTSALYVLYIYVPTTYCTRYARRTVEESGG